MNLSREDFDARVLPLMLAEKPNVDFIVHDTQDFGWPRLIALHLRPAQRMWDCTRDGERLRGEELRTA